MAYIDEILIGNESKGDHEMIIKERPSSIYK
jgi:hypothetical protein